MIKLARYSDMQEILKLHEQFYSHDFEFPDPKHILKSFIVSNKDGEVITFGAVRTTLEVVAITDYEASIRDRIVALRELREAMKQTAKEYDYDQMHAVVLDDSNWSNVLLREGFKPAKGEFLILNLE
jgi:VIT1/CCC1 family predicted Fe2+/Mn2+ transporter